MARASGSTMIAAGEEPTLAAMPSIHWRYSAPDPMPPAAKLPQSRCGIPYSARTGMAPAACASPTYFEIVAAEPPGTIQYACGVLAIAVNWGFGGSVFCAARIAADVGLT